MTKLKWLLQVATVVALACSSDSGCTQEANKYQTSDVHGIGQALSLRLPQGTEVIGVLTESALDDAILVKLRIPASERENFLRDCVVKRFKPGGADLLGPDRGFWDPHRAKSLRWGEVALESNRALLVVLDDSRSDSLVVYAMNYSS
jgi:hypothetical protein